MPKVNITENLKFDYTGKRAIGNLLYDNIKLWIDLGDTPVDKSKYSASISSIAYVGTPTIDTLSYDYFSYNTAEFNDTSNIDALVTYSSADNPINFRNSTNTADLPFSWSCFFKVNSGGNTANEYLFGKNDLGFYSYIQRSTGRLYFFITSGSTGQYIRKYITVPNFSLDTWYQIIATYDGSESANGINIYIDGVAQSGSTYSYNYTGIINTGSKLFVGSSYSGTSEFDGKLSEITFFDKELTSDEAEHLYNMLIGSWITQSPYESGYLTNPTRVLIREKDNKNGSYPTKLRFGTYDRSGDLPIHFNDQNTLRYGDSIHDDFIFKNNTNTTAIFPNRSLWAYSPQIEIRREEKEKSGNFKDGVLVFSGKPDGNGRWIQTRKKVRNPTVVFELLQGPYQEGDKLNLSQGKKTDVLKVQISPDGSSWTDIEINESNVSNPRFLNGNTYFTPTFNNKLLKLNIDGKIKKRKEKRLSCFVKLDMKSFKMPGKDFYIRIIQPSVSYDKSSTWGIEYIKIISRNDSLEYPLLARQDHKSFSLSLTGSIDTPNTYSNLFATGSSIANLTDSHVSFQEFEENISSFNDNRQINDNGEIFYDEGLDDEVYPGFNSKLFSKDVIEIDLSTSSPTTIGFNQNIQYPAINTFTNDTGIGHNFMTYWNNDLKKWEKVGYPFTFNNFPSSDIDSLISEVLTGSCVGFTPVIRNISNNSEFVSNEIQNIQSSELLPKDVISVSNKPTTEFNFPYGPQYHATGSQTIVARDLGITKPFLLEKIELDFNASFNFAEYDNGFGGGAEDRGIAYSIGVGYGSSLNPSTTLPTMINLIVPTFFMLRQKKDTYNILKNINYGMNGAQITDEYNIVVPQTKTLTKTGPEVFIDTSRDLITYGQIGIFTSGSYLNIDSLNYKTLTIDDSPVSLEDIVNLGFNFDNIYTRIETNPSPPALEGKFNFKSKVKRFSDIASPFSSYSANFNTIEGLLRLTNASKDLNNSRQIVNGVPSFKPEASGLIHAITPQAEPFEINVDKRENQEKTSAYIIMPDDELILGWQYPIPDNLYDSAPVGQYAPTDPNNYFQMTLDGVSKLKLYGSSIQDGKEYHEGLNQHLTSDAIHETIGNDAVLDQFQIATRGELTGSILADFAIFMGSNNGNNDALVFGGLIFPNTVNNAEAFKRIGSLVISSVGERASNVINKIERGNFIKNVFNLQASDLKRKYIDCFYIPASIAETYDGNVLEGAYFSSQTYGLIPSMFLNSALTISGKNEYFGLSPQYSFNSSHFGHYADMFQQGRDGKFIDDPTTTKDDIVVSSPVSVIFVKGKYFDEDLSFRRFDFVDVSTIDGTSALEFQSSNLSLNSTSDFAFYDDGVARNRTYGVETLTVSWGINEWKNTSRNCN